MPYCHGCKEINKHKHSSSSYSSSISMNSSINSSSFLQILSFRSVIIALILTSSLLRLSFCHQLSSNEEEKGVLRRRKLLGFKEKPSGSNTTFECSPSGPCVPCQYSEKSDDKYRCSETGYRIPFKCLKTGDVAKGAGDKGSQKSQSTQEGPVNADNSEVKHRPLAYSDTEHNGESQEYVTYRSCIQGVNEEKLSVLGFESMNPVHNKSGIRAMINHAPCTGEKRAVSGRFNSEMGKIRSELTTSTQNLQSTVHKITHSYGSLAVEVAKLKSHVEKLSEILNNPYTIKIVIILL